MLTCEEQVFPGGSVVKNPPANAGDVGLIPRSGGTFGRENGNPLQYSVPWTEEPGQLQSMDSQGVGHDWAPCTREEQCHLNCGQVVLLYLRTSHDRENHVQLKSLQNRDSHDIIKNRDPAESHKFAKNRWLSSQITVSGWWVSVCAHPCARVRVRTSWLVWGRGLERGSKPWRKTWMKMGGGFNVA